jgi:orotidine-5'-phosphate decarboxylase
MERFLAGVALVQSQSFPYHAGGMKSKLIVALDVDSFQEAAGLVQATRDVVDVFKVGSQLFTRVGPRIIEFLLEQGKDCFLDLKFHDIPNTVAKAVESAVALQVRMLTLHASGGAEMLRAAATVPNRPLLLGVTVLTSVGGNVQEEALRLARLAKKCGMNGVIASPREIHPLREMMGGKFLIVTPGIRPAKTELGDQRRAMTPAEAIIAGADCVVVGRPIIAAKNPAHAALKIAEEIVFAAGAG